MWNREEFRRVVEELRGKSKARQDAAERMGHKPLADYEAGYQAALSLALGLSRPDADVRETPPQGPRSNL